MVGKEATSLRAGHMLGRRLKSALRDLDMQLLYFGHVDDLLLVSLSLALCWTLRNLRRLGNLRLSGQWKAASQPADSSGTLYSQDKYCDIR